jgi:hypothetical protein
VVFPPSMAIASFVATGRDIEGDGLDAPGLIVKIESYYDNNSNTHCKVNFMSFQKGTKRHPSENRLTTGRQNADTAFTIQVNLLAAKDDTLICKICSANFTSMKPVVAGMTNRSFGATTSSKV